MPPQEVSFRYDEAVSPRQAQVDMLREHLVDQVAENRYISSVPLNILLKKPWESLRMDERWVWRQAAEEHVRGLLSNLPRTTSPQDISLWYDEGVDGTVTNLRLHFLGDHPDQEYPLSILGPDNAKRLIAAFKWACTLHQQGGCYDSG